MISSDEPLLSVDDLADQVVEVLDFFGYVCHLSLYNKLKFLTKFF